MNGERRTQDDERRTKANAHGPQKSRGRANTAAGNGDRQFGLLAEHDGGARHVPERCSRPAPETVSDRARCA